MSWGPSGNPRPGYYSSDLSPPGRGEGVGGGVETGPPGGKAAGAFSNTNKRGRRQVAAWTLENPGETSDEFHSDGKGWGRAPPPSGPWANPGDGGGPCNTGLVTPDSEWP